MICHFNRGFKFNLTTEISKFTELWKNATKEVKSSTNTAKEEIIGNVNQCVLDSIRADFKEFACTDKNDSYFKRLGMLTMFLEVNWYCTGSRNTTRLCKIARILQRNVETLKSILRPSLCRSERQKRHFTIISTESQSRQFYCAKKDEVRHVIISDDSEWVLENVTALKILAKYVNVGCCFLGVAELLN